VEAEFVSIFRWNGSLRIESNMMSRGITWLITVGETLVFRTLIYKRVKLESGGALF